MIITRTYTEYHHQHFNITTIIIVIIIFHAVVITYIIVMTWYCIFNIILIFIFQFKHGGYILQTQKKCKFFIVDDRYVPPILWPIIWPFARLTCGLLSFHEYSFDLTRKKTNECSAIVSNAGYLSRFTNSATHNIYIHTQCSVLYIHIYA